MKAILVLLAITGFAVVVNGQCVSCSSYWNYAGFTNVGSFRGIDSTGQVYNKEYYVPTWVRATWSQARSFCQSYGLEILSLDSLAEANAFLNLAQANRDDMDPYIYIGGTTSQLKNSTAWFWVNSGTKVSYTLKWAPGNPDNFSGREACLCLSKLSDGFYFNDISCYGSSEFDLYKFVCQGV